MKVDASAGFRFWIPIASPRDLQPDTGTPSFFYKFLWLQDGRGLIFARARLRCQALPTKISLAIAINLFLSWFSWERANCATHWNG